MRETIPTSCTRNHVSDGPELGRAGEKMGNVRV